MKNISGSLYGKEAKIIQLSKPKEKDTSEEEAYLLRGIEKQVKGLLSTIGDLRRLSANKNYYDLHISINSAFDTLNKIKSE